MAEGFVYVLVSANSEFVKIGRTEKTPFHRLREINLSESYSGSGPWDVSDFRQVKDCAAVKSHLHRWFAHKRVRTVPGAEELFAVSPVEARKVLEEINEDMLVDRETVDKMMIDRDFSLYLQKLFKFTGLPAWLSVQGAWVFTLYPSTDGGAYFTISIGRHAVTMSLLPNRDRPLPRHEITMDRLILDFKEVRRWVEAHKGKIFEDYWPSALPRSVTFFFADFAEAERFFSLDGVRRAMIAYWTEALIGLNERGSLSLYARHHNYNAVARIVNEMRGQKMPIDSEPAGPTGGNPHHHE